MRNKTHDEQVERWANFVKENPGKWKEKVKPFLDAQIEIARRFYKKLNSTEEGKKIARELLALNSDVKVP